MTAEGDKGASKFDYLNMLRRAEPIAILASISLIITVFTFENRTNFQAVYNYSIISTFMFIISFLFAVIPKGLEMPSGMASKDEPLDNLLKYGTYFFLIIGLIYLLLIAIEFGKQHEQVFAFVTGWFISFMAIVSIMFVYRACKRPQQGGQTRQSEILAGAEIAVFSTIGTSGSLLAVVNLVEGFMGTRPAFIPYETTSIIVTASLSALAALGLIKDAMKKKKTNQQNPIA